VAPKRSAGEDLGRSDEQEHGGRIDEAADQPRAGDAIDLRPRARDPERPAGRVPRRQVARVDQHAAGIAPGLEPALQVLRLRRAEVAQPGRDSLAELQPALADDDDRPPGVGRPPFRDAAEIAPDRAGQEARIGLRVLGRAHIDQHR
jgi:hypothetical protein